MSIEICVRLKEERERLGLIQQQLADIGGVTKTTLFNYENGREPSSKFLSAIAAAGADVLYILTGQRAGGTSALSPRKAALLDSYDASDEAGKKIIEGTASLAAQSGMRKVG